MHHVMPKSADSAISISIGFVCKNLDCYFYVVCCPLADLGVSMNKSGKLLSKSTINPIQPGGQEGISEASTFLLLVTEEKRSRQRLATYMKHNCLFSLANH